MKKQLIEWTINEVAPEANQSGDPEAAILKVATARNLPPAAVERLGHLWNTGRTLNHLEKSANRADNVPLVDVPALVSKYSSYNPKDDIVGFKEPEPKRFPGVAALMGLSDGASVGLKIASEKTKEVDPRSRLHPEAIMVEIRDYSKCAKQALGNADAVRYDREKIDAALVDNQSRVYKDWDFTKEATDYLMVEPEAKAIITHMGNVLKTAGLIKEVPDGNAELRNKVSYANVRDWVDKYANLQEQAEYLVKYASYCVGEIHRFGGMDDSVKPHAEKVAGMIESLMGPSSLRDETVMDDFIRAGDQGAKKKSLKQKRPAVNSILPKEDLGIGQSVKQLGGDLSKTLGIALEQKLPGGSRLDSVLAELVSGKGKSDQEYIDNSVLDLRRKTLLQDLLITDDVLADAAPERVEEAYNSILRFSPDLATDRNTLMTLLHGMLAHEGLDPTTAKSLMETEMTGGSMRRDQEQTRNKNYRPAAKPTEE
jgi:hypothetical protein